MKMKVLVTPIDTIIKRKKNLLKHFVFCFPWASQGLSLGTQGPWASNAAVYDEQSRDITAPFFSMSYQRAVRAKKCSLTHCCSPWPSLAQCLAPKRGSIESFEIEYYVWVEPLLQLLILLDTTLWRKPGGLKWPLLWGHRHVSVFFLFKESNILSHSTVTEHLSSGVWISSHPKSLEK